VALSHYVLGERLVPNQYVGIAAVVGGLLLLGVGA
jgi:drug/metabolite transporter (DMT)-like permease